MDELRPLSATEAREPLARLLRRARAFDVAYDVEVGLARHHRAVADGLTPSVATAANVSKWAWIVLATALMTGAWLSTRSTAPTVLRAPESVVATATAVTMPSPPAAAAPAAMPQTRATPTAPTVDQPTSRKLAARSSAAGRATRVSAPEPPRAPAAVVEPAPDDRIAREAAQIRVIRRDLAADRAAAALRACDDGDASFADGVFAAEREGLRVLALFELGRRDEAERAASRYLDAHPHGALVAKIRAARAP